jgi:hypothetical protein
MRWACEYESKSGAVGLIIFSAKDLNAAQIYVEEMITYYGHNHVFNLNELTEGSIGELYRLFPRLAKVVDRGDIPTRKVVITVLFFHCTAIARRNSSTIAASLSGEGFCGTLLVLSRPSRRA